MGKTARLFMFKRTSRPRLWPPVALALLAVLVVFNLIEAVSLVKRARAGTDFTVFYNTGRLLDAGAGGELYRGTDQTTEWLRTIPPFGQTLIFPFGQGNIQTAAALWSVFNLALLGATALSLRFVARNLKCKRRVFGAVWPYAVLVLLALAPGSLQVGQFSVLFAACWVFYLALRASRWKFWAGAALALPVAVKIYPFLLLLVPLLSRRPRAFGIALFFVALLTVSPVVLYGARTGELTQSFWNNAIVSSGGRVAEAQRASSPANQGLDSVALRFLTNNQPIQKSHPQLPHLALSARLVLRGVNLARLAVVLVSLCVGWSFYRSAQKSPLWGEAMFMALLCAALYVILPGAKTRYAIYAFPAFWPLLCCAFAAARLHRKRVSWAWSAAIIVGCVLIGSTPAPLRLWGIGWLGALGLWIFNLLILWKWSHTSARKSPVATSV